MTKIEEVIDNYSQYDDPGTLRESLERAMKEYAEHYAKECLKIAANEAIADMSFMNATAWVHKDSILNIKLPDHD